MTKGSFELHKEKLRPTYWNWTRKTSQSHYLTIKKFSINEQGESDREESLSNPRCHHRQITTITIENCSTDKIRTPQTPPQAEVKELESYWRVYPSSIALFKKHREKPTAEKTKRKLYANFAEREFHALNSSTRKVRVLCEPRGNNTIQSGGAPTQHRASAMTTTHQTQLEASHELITERLVATLE